MANNVEFKDFSVQVKAAIEDKCLQWLYEIAGEIVAETDRNLDKEKGRWHTEQKEQWRFEVDEGKMEAVVGNPMERAIWTEFGTGSYAEKGNGRQGYWVYVKGSDGSVTEKSSKAYTLAEAKQIMAMLRADGLDAHITNGQQPKRPFRTAYTKVKPKALRRAREIFGDMK